MEGGVTNSAYIIVIQAAPAQFHLQLRINCNGYLRVLQLYWQGQAVFTPALLTTAVVNSIS